MIETKIKLADCVSFVSRGITPSYVFENGLCVVNQKCIRNGRLDFENARLHNQSKKRVPLEKIVKTNDILINSTGVGTLGRVCQINEIAFPFCVDGHVTIVRPDSSKINPIFLGIMLHFLEDRIESLGEGSTGEIELYKDVLLDFEITKPSEAIQNKIANTLNKVDLLIEGKVKEIETLKELKRKLMPSLLSDQIKDLF